MQWLALAALLAAACEHPVTRRGTVVDADGGRAIAGALVVAVPPDARAAALAQTRTDANGRYVLGAVPSRAAVMVLMPGYQRARATDERTRLDRLEVRAVYVNAESLDERSLGRLLDDLDRDVNAIVIDVKDDGRGQRMVSAAQLGAALARARARRFYTIARISVMRDDALARQQPKWALHKSDGQPFRDAAGFGWLDPRRPEVWDYDIALGRRMVSLGFDEIQFDYVRFPHGTPPIDTDAPGDARYQTIDSQLQRAHAAVNSQGGFFSVDVFGTTMFAPEPRIGQRLDLQARDADYVCPMLYPSLFARDSERFPGPEKHPYEVIRTSLEEGRRKMAGAPSLLRPWLQAFSLRTPYGLDEIRAQVEGALDSSAAVGFSFWNHGSRYPHGIF